MINKRLTLLIACLLSFNTVQTMQQVERKAEQSKAEQKKYNAQATEALKEYMAWGDFKNDTSEERLVRIKKLLEEGADPNIFGFEPLHILIGGGVHDSGNKYIYDIALYKELLEAGAEPFCTTDVYAPTPEELLRLKEMPRERGRRRSVETRRLLYKKLTPRERLEKEIEKLKNPEENPELIKKLQEIIALLREYELKAIRPAPPLPPAAHPSAILEALESQKNATVAASAASSASAAAPGTASLRSQEASPGTAGSGKEA